MVKQSIQIFARVKPTKAKQGLYEITGGDEASPLLHFTVPKDLAGGFVNNKKEVYKFSFEKVFDQNAKQDEIFNSVAKPVIDNVLAGYNGTIFAYGQTGSGKTFTITGGAERFMDRGIIPRTLSYIFDYFEKNPGNEYNTYISYLELYNESGYDLLDPKHEAAKLEDLPKVSLMEDNDQNIHLKNLSTHNANNEEEALNLLFLGDTNRMIAETPMNQASTRSHCIFTVHVSSREVGSATIRRSKLHLVDLAGSERVSKTGVNGTLLTEAKYINLSLHYLEQVIVALAEKSRQHIPYRNSMMTSVLRDSLGGNCMTTMIATCSVEKKNVDESISTCRFAQRVALIKNDATLNEELDPKLMIQRLKKEVAQLKDELNMATGEQRTDALTEEDIERCRDAVKYYLEDPDMDAMLRIGADMRLIQECFRILKGHALHKGPRGSSQASLTPAPEHTPRPLPMAPADSTEAKKLRDLIRQRDNEINILVNMLKKEKKRAADAIGRLENLGQPVPRASSNISESSVPVDTRSSVMTNGGASVRQPVREARSMSVNTESLAGRKVKDEKEEKIKTKILGDMSMGRQEAFEIFRRDYPQNPHIEENKRILKQKYAEAKSLGESVNQSRKKMNKLKASIEQHRMSRVMQGLVDPENPEPDEMEQEIRSQMEHEKASYRDCFSSLRNLKTEIEHLQHLMEKDKVKLMKDFEIWWAEQAASVQAQQDVLKGPKTKAAWRTPPLTPSHSKQVFSVSASQSSLASDSPINKGGGEPRIEAASTGTNSAYTSGYGSHNSDHSHRGNGHRSSKAEKSSSSIPMTGDAQADADIMAFLKARKNILKHAQSQGQR